MAFDFNSVEDTAHFDEKTAEQFSLAPYLKALAEIGDDSYEAELLEVERVELENSHDFSTEKVKSIIEAKATKDGLELTTIYLDAVNRTFGSQITVKGAENVARLLRYFKVDLADIPNLMDNFFEALGDYGCEHGFIDASDYKHLLVELDIPFNEEISK
ncbi:MAG: hypothetical protein NC453_19345 [Muribaculum sp.]|nr:hypothetical protein [Muribaculum sp.]